MPKDKDLKRLARQRMEKTGESYTTARVQLLARKSLDGERLGEAELAELAGISTAAVQRATQHDWGWWLEHLNAATCRQQEHREIAQYVAREFAISPWWAQTLTVGIYRIVGLREIGQRREGSYEASNSRTLPVPIEILFRDFDDEDIRRLWLPKVEWQVRKSTTNRSIRLDWPGGCRVDLWFTAKGDAKSSVQIQHRKLPAKEEVVRVKGEWAQRLAALTRYLDGSS